MVCTYWEYMMALEELRDMAETPEVDTPEARRMLELEELVQAYEEDRYGEA